jgi:cell division protease FtsH
MLVKRARWYARLARWFSRRWGWFLLFGTLYWLFFTESARDFYVFAVDAWQSIHQINRTLISLTLGTTLQLMFAISYVVIQFVALFYFLGRPKTEVIRPEDPKSATFKDYWGQPALVSLVRQWITLLADRDQFQKMGGKFINGILLYGPPGTGKTMLAKCMAGEAGIPFISTEGSAFRGMFIGMDVLRMLQFVGRAKKLAREYGACIAYIDEIDSVGASRGGNAGGLGMGGGGFFGMGNGALTRLLHEMDGAEDLSLFERLKTRWYKFIGKPKPRKSWHVLYMGSTNLVEVLDAALLRPGRFDTKIRIDKPDRAGRREVIKGYLTKVKHDETIDVEAIVEDTPIATPAMLASAITKDAVRIAQFSGRSYIKQQDIDSALQEQYFGLEQPIAEFDPVQRKMLAYHEAGHAVTQHFLMPEQRIVRLTIVRRGNALGYMHPVDKVEMHGYPLRRLAADIIVSMAGHVAVKMKTGEPWTGATGDNANIRLQLWKLYVHGYFGPPVLGWENGAGNGGIPASAAPLLDRFWRVLDDQTEQVLRKHWDKVEALVEALLERDNLNGTEVLAILGDNGWQKGSETAFPDYHPFAVQTGLPAGAGSLLPVPTAAVSAPTMEAAPLLDGPLTVASPTDDEHRERHRMLTPPRPEEFASRKISESHERLPAQTDGKHE